MSVQNKIDNELSVLVDNISKIALAIERKGVHSSGELANYHTEIDSIVSSGNVISEDKKSEIVLEFVKSLGYSSPSDIKSAYSYLSDTLGLFFGSLLSSRSDSYGVAFSIALGLVGFVISRGVDVSTLTFKYTIVGIDGTSYTSELIHPEDGLNCVVRTLPAYNDSLLGKEDERTLISFLTDINLVGNNLKSYTIDVFVNGNKLEFKKQGSTNENTVTISSDILGKTFYGDSKRTKYYIDYNSSISGDSLYRKLKYIYSLSNDGTELTTYLDRDSVHKDSSAFEVGFGMTNTNHAIPKGVTTIISSSYFLGYDYNILNNISMDYNYVNSFVSRGYIFKFVPDKVSIVDEQGFVGMRDAKEPIGVTLWNGEVVIFPKGTNKYNLKTKTFETWDGQSYTQEDYL